MKIWNRIEARLSGIRGRLISENVKTSLTLTVEEHASVPGFLRKYQDIFEDEQIFCLFNTPVSWTSLALECTKVCMVEFDEIPAFNAVLDKIRVRRVVKGDNTKFIYHLDFYTDQLTPEELSLVYTYLNQKIEDPQTGIRTFEKYGLEIDFEV